MFFLLCVRRACADAFLPSDAGPAAASDEEAGGCSSGSSRGSTKGRAATARTGHCTAEGEHTAETQTGVSHVNN